jgi:hypothetical protein
MYGLLYECKFLTIEETNKKKKKKKIFSASRVRVMVFNTTFNNISVIS